MSRLASAEAASAKHLHVWNRPVLAWSLYDFANTIYSMNIVSLYLKRYVVEDLGYRDLWFDIPFSISMLLSAIIAPALGAISDHQAKKKLFLCLFTLTCCLATMSMGLLSSFGVWVVMSLFVLANLCYEAGQPFYNALLYAVADGISARYVSGIGVALGYLGSIIGMLLVLPFVTGDLFGLVIPFITAGGKVAAFVPTALLFALFALPIFFFVREQSVSGDPITLSQAYGEVADGLTRTRQYPGVARFLTANFFFQDAANTVILNIGIYCSLVIGLAEGEITIFLIICTVAAMIGSFFIGRLSVHWSLHHLILTITALWVAALVTFALTSSTVVVWVLGCLVGILLGGLWTTTRPMLAELVPHEQLGRFFGLFAVVGRAAAILGPLLWTLIVFQFSADQPLGAALAGWLELDENARAQLPYRLAVISLGLMMAAGWFIFRGVSDKKVRPNV